MPVADCDPLWRIALLRAVNLGRHNKAPAVELRALMTDEGLIDGETLLASGNMIFRDERAPSVLEPILERALHKRLQLTTAVIVREAADWLTLIDANPFRDLGVADPSRLVLFVLKGMPRRDGFQRLSSLIRGHEQVHLGDRAVYLTYPDGIGTSKLTAGVIDGALGVSGTGRNWNTVLKLASLTSR